MIPTAEVQIHGPGLCSCKYCIWLQFGWITGDAWGHYGLKFDPFKTNRAVTAIVSGRLVGLLRYTVKPDGMETFGTYVAPSARRRGLAQHLWERAIRQDRPQAITVTCVSHKGYTLVASMVERWPKIRWNVIHQGGRKRRLK